MKTSKIIFISFFGVVGLFLLSLLIQTDPEKRGNKDLLEMKHEVVALTSFSHLIIKDSCDILISSGRSDSIELYYNKDIKLEHPIYSVNGDTLIIEPVPGKERSNTNILCHNLKSVSMVNAKLNISKLTLPSLFIEGINSTICLYDSVTLKTANFHLKSGSQIWCENIDMDTLLIEMEKSNANFNVELIDELKAKLRDSSELSTWKVLRSDVQTDETSRYYSR